jgi:hypothetical protein
LLIPKIELIFFYEKMSYNITNYLIKAKPVVTIALRGPKHNPPDYSYIHRVTSHNFRRNTKAMLSNDEFWEIIDIIQWPIDRFIGEDEAIELITKAIRPIKQKKEFYFAFEEKYQEIIEKVNNNGFLTEHIILSGQAWYNLAVDGERSVIKGLLERLHNIPSVIPILLMATELN